MRKFFIDCGGNDGCSVRAFREKFDPDNEFKVITFEANPIFSKFYKKFENHEYYEAAVWDEETQLEFYLGNKPSSSLLKEKKSGMVGKKGSIVVNTVRLSTFLEQNTEKNDLIFLKLDIEGAEYQVLEDLFNTGEIARIDRLFIEWHSKKLRDPKNEKSYREREILLKEKLKALGLKAEKWNAMSYRLKK